MRIREPLKAAMIACLLASCEQKDSLDTKIQKFISANEFDSALILIQQSKNDQNPCEYAMRIIRISKVAENIDSLVLSTKSTLESCDIPADSLRSAFSAAYFGMSKKYSDIDSLEERKWLENARNEAKKCVNENPNSIECYKSGAKAIHNLHNSEEELRWIIPAYKKWPSDPEISTLYGVALMMSGDYFSAASILEKCYQCIDSQNPNRKTCAAGLRFRGHIFYDLGKPDSALKDFHAAWAANSLDFQTPTAIGRIWKEKGKQDSACKYYREGLKVGDITHQEWVRENCNKL